MTIDSSIAKLSTDRTCAVGASAAIIQPICNRLELRALVLTWIVLRRSGMTPVNSRRQPGCIRRIRRDSGRSIVRLHEPDPPICVGVGKLSWVVGGDFS